LRRRPDLEVREQSYLGRRYWVVKDPLSLKYYRFEEEEYAILEMLDGRSGLAEIQRRFERRFAPQKITLGELHQLMGMLHRSSLVVSDASGQGDQLLERRRRRSRREALAAATNVLSLRFRLFDPDELLGSLDRFVGWLFSPACAAAGLLLAVAALLLLGAQFDVFRSRLPAFDSFFASGNWIWLAVALALTKIVHEFGHGLACKRFGGECHEMGVMLLVLTPCLYCDVSDSWMLPSKWRRAAIGAAGMYIEVLLASVCTFLWWFTQPGLLHYLCLNVMFICSVSTLAFNANPLLRFDGYYILSDLLEIPNLRQKASAILRRHLAAACLGISAAPDPFLPQRRQLFFAIYAVAAGVYRWVVALAILWFLNLVFKPYGLRVVGQLIAVVALYGLLVQPLWQLTQFLRVPGRMDRVKKPRLLACSVVAAVLLGAALFLPTPHYVRCTLYLEPRDAASVYVESPGELTAIHARPGDWIRAGQPLLTLDHVDIRLSVRRLESEKRQLESKLRTLRQQAFEDETAALQIAEVEQAIASLEEQLARRRRDCQRLVVAAPVSGVVIAPPRKSGADASGLLPTWSGSPLDAQNLRAYLEEGTAVCHIGDPRRFRAILAVDQGDLEFLHPGQAVDLVLEPLPRRKYRSRIDQVSQLDMQVTPHNLSSAAGGDLLTQRGPGGLERPLNTTYQASAALTDEEGWLFVGATGQARIHTGTQTMARRMWRYLCRNFRFDV
jgi:putative peptide zinc metalloprotease protein